MVKVNVLQIKQTIQQKYQTPHINADHHHYLHFLRLDKLRLSWAIAEGTRDALYSSLRVVNCCTSVRKIIYEKSCNRRMPLKVTQGRRKWRCLISHASLPASRLYNNVFIFDKILKITDDIRFTISVLTNMCYIFRVTGFRKVSDKTCPSGSCKVTDFAPFGSLHIISC